jgi:hypothetical protein
MMLPFLSPRSPNSIMSLCHGILPKVGSALFTTLNWGGGGGGETKFILSMFNNFVILAGMVSRVLSKIVNVAGKCRISDIDISLPSVPLNCSWVHGLYGYGIIIKYGFLKRNYVKTIQLYGAKMENVKDRGANH